MSTKPCASEEAQETIKRARKGASFQWRMRRLFFAGGGVVLSLATTFLGLLLITFMIGRLIPLDPVLAIVGERASEATYNKIYEQLGLDLPIWQQFLIYALRVIQGDLGMSVLTARPVVDDIARVFPATAELAGTGIILGILIGVPTGVWAAVYRNSLLDHIMRVVGLVGYSVPVFWLGIMCLLIFYSKLQWIGGPGRLEFYLDDIVPTVTGMILIDAAIAREWGVFSNAFSHIVLPASLLGYYSLAYISRMTRSLMLEQLNQEYIVTARVKGVPERRIIWFHAFRNILVPLITVVALSFASLLEGSVLTETVFAWPGLGRYITNALLAADMNAVLGGTIVVGCIFVGLNLFSDLLYKLVDPRAR